MNVSVVITCFNEGAYVGEAVRSVLHQTRADRVCEILIADDGSDEPTLAVLDEIAGWDARVRVSYGRGNGLSRNRNRVAAEATGEIIAILDGDDIWAPQKLEKQLPLFSDPAVGLSYTGFFSFAGADLSTARTARLRPIPAGRALALAYFLNDPPIIPSTLLIRRDLYEALGGFAEDVRVFEDTDFYLRAAQRTRFAAVDEPLLYKRNHGRSITAKSDEMLMHHALVAFRFAKSCPAALPLVPRRLAERATKLGNQAFFLGDLPAARRFFAFALAQRPWNLKALAGWAMCLPLSAVGRWLLEPMRRRRAAAIVGRG